MAVFLAFLRRPAGRLTAGVLICCALLAPGAYWPDRPIAQYIGNAAGIFLGVVLGLWFTAREQESAHKEAVADFHQDLADMKRELGNKVVRCKSSDISLILLDGRLPMREIDRLCSSGASVRAQPGLRSVLIEIRQTAAKIDGQLALGHGYLTGFRPNFDTQVGELERALAKLP